MSGRAYMSSLPWGHVAEWLRNGLQNRVHQFNSGRGLHQRYQILARDLSCLAGAGAGKRCAFADWIMSCSPCPPAGPPTPGNSPRELLGIPETAKPDLA